jgi:hypothetical protein
MNKTTITDEKNSVYLCTWVNETCINGYDIELISTSDCYTEFTGYQLTWDSKSNNCTKCPGHSYILMTSLLINIIISI